MSKPRILTPFHRPIVILFHRRLELDGLTGGPRGPKTPVLSGLTGELRPRPGRAWESIRRC